MTPSRGAQQWSSAREYGAAIDALIEAQEEARKLREELESLRPLAEIGRLAVAWKEAATATEEFDELADWANVPEFMQAQYEWERTMQELNAGLTEFVAAVRGRKED